MGKILELPNDLYEKIEETIKGTEFKSVEEGSQTLCSGLSQPWNKINNI